MITYLLLLFSLLRSALRSRQCLVLENIALRQQLAVLSRQSRRPRLRATDRLFWLAEPPGHRAAGDSDPVAAQGLATVLDLEEQTASGSGKAACPQ